MISDLASSSRLLKGNYPSIGSLTNSKLNSPCPYVYSREGFKINMNLISGTLAKLYAFKLSQMKIYIKSKLCVFRKKNLA